MDKGEGDAIDICYWTAESAAMLKPDSHNVSHTTSQLRLIIDARYVEVVVQRAHDAFPIMGGKTNLKTYAILLQD